MNDNPYQSRKITCGVNPLRIEARGCVIYVDTVPTGTRIEVIPSLADDAVGVVSKNDATGNCHVRIGSPKWIDGKRVSDKGDA